MLKHIGFALICVFTASLFLNIDMHALAQSSLGVGRSEQAIKPEGIFGGLLFWIQQQQQSFYKAMTTSLKAIKNDGKQNVASCSPSLQHFCKALQLSL